MLVKGNKYTNNISLLPISENYSLLSQINLNNNKSNYNVLSTVLNQNKHINMSMNNKLNKNMLQSHKHISDYDESKILKKLDIPLKLKLNLLQQEEEFKKANEYDYKELRKFFDKKNLIRKFRKSMLSPIKKQNKRWKNNLERYKIQKEEQQKLLEKKLEDKMNTREDKANNLLNANNKSKLKSKQENLKLKLISRQKVKQSLDKYYANIEKQRLETEEKVLNKLKRREINQEHNINNIKEYFQSIRLKSENRFNKNIDLLLKENKEKVKKVEQLKKDQFYNCYNSMLKNRKTFKVLKNKNTKARENAVRNQIEKDNIFNEQRNQTDIKLKEAEDRRINIKKENDLKLKNIIDKNTELMNSAIERKALIKNNEKRNIKELLYNQLNKLKKPIEKDFVHDLTKVNNQ